MALPMIDQRMARALANGASAAARVRAERRARAARRLRRRRRRRRARRVAAAIGVASAADRREPAIATLVSPSATITARASGRSHVAISAAAFARLTFAKHANALAARRLMTRLVGARKTACTATAQLHASAGGRPARHWCRRSRTNSTARRRSARLRACAARDRSAVSTDGLSRLMVGGATWSRIASIEKIASTAPAAPSRWPIDDLVDDIEMRAGGIADQALDRARARSRRRAASRCRGR